MHSKSWFTFLCILSFCICLEKNCSFTAESTPDFLSLCMQISVDLVFSKVYVRAYVRSKDTVRERSKAGPWQRLWLYRNLEQLKNRLEFIKEIIHCNVCQGKSYTHSMGLSYDPLNKSKKCSIQTMRSLLTTITVYRIR